MWMQIASMIGKGAGNLMQGWGDYQAAKMASGQAQYSAEQEEQAGAEMARLIRRAGNRLRGAQVAAYAGSGVKIGEGSAGELERETVTNTEHDAFQAILTGQRRALAIRTQDKLNRISAKAAWTATAIDPLFANSSSFSGWRTYNPNYQGQAGGGGFDAGLGRFDMSGADRGQA